MSSEKPNFLSQPVVKNVFMFRNGDPYYEARRIVINQKRVCNFETLLREVTGGIQAPFGAVRNIYTPRGGHKVDSLESLRNGEQYVAAGREKFRKLDYLEIGSRKKKMMQTLRMQAKPFPPNRIVVSARFLKPIKEPCTIFVVANGDILDPAIRLLVHQRMLGQFDRILEMITEKMGLRVLGGVRSLYTYEGQQVTDGNQLESGQLYVAVGREKFKKLPYSDLLFTKPRGTRRAKGLKAYSLPPIYRFSKQSENRKSMVRSSDSGDEESPKTSPPNHNKEHLSSIVREISQARLLSLRSRKSRQSLTLGTSDNDELELKVDEGNADCQTLPENHAEAKPDATDANATEENDEKPEEKEGTVSENSREEDALPNNENKKENQESNSKKEGEGKTETDGQNDGKEGEETTANEKKVEELKEEEKKEEVTEESKEEVKSEEQGSSTDKTLDSKEKEDGGHSSSQGEKEQTVEEEKEDKGSSEIEKSNEDHTNDVDSVEEQKETENSNDPGKTKSDNETKENDSDTSSGGNSNQEEDVSKTKKGVTKESGEEGESKVKGEVSGEDNEVESEAELEIEEKKIASEDAMAKGETEENGDKENQNNSKNEND